VLKLVLLGIGGFMPINWTLNPKEKKYYSFGGYYAFVFQRIEGKIHVDAPIDDGCDDEDLGQTCFLFKCSKPSVGPLCSQTCVALLVLY
jgi:hypothetical protein